MYCITLDSDDPFFNLAIEEILLKESKDEYLILGINTPSVIIGKHQSAHREVNTKFVSENDIPVIRRISGGGTVFHDRGNLNFTFIRQSETGKQVDFRKYTKPVIDFLLTLGVEAKFEGKNDLRVGGLKISGNAEHVFRKRVLHHGTLLFSSSMDMLKNSLRKDTSCYSSRAVGSNPSSVINLNEIVSCFQDIHVFRSEMMNYFLETFQDSVVYQLLQSEREKAELLASSKYKTWEWNWAYGPEYHYANRFEIDGNPFSCQLFVKDGIILECEIEGSDEMKAVGKELIGERYMVNDLMEVFQNENISIPKKDIYKFF
ncbi:MAG TPA: lipoate--protein ligase [Bacteroidales bacterium]|nr:lipoate--protein ligase [Bacteroidales bacterium]